MTLKRLKMRVQKSLDYLTELTPMMHSAAQKLGKHIANQKHRRHFQEKKTASWRATHIFIFRNGNQSMKLKFCVSRSAEQMDS